MFILYAFLKKLSMHFKLQKKEKTACNMRTVFLLRIPFIYTPFFVKISAFFVKFSI